MIGDNIRDLRPNLVGTLQWKGDTWVDPPYKVAAGMCSYFGTYQVREVSKGFLPCPLPISYGFVHPIRSARFRKITGVDSPNPISECRTAINAYGPGSYLEIRIPHLWSVSSGPVPTSVPVETLPAALFNTANTMAQSRVSLSGWEGAVEMAELPETIAFMGKPHASMDRVLSGFNDKVEITYNRNVRASSKRYHTKQQKSWDKAQAIMQTWLAGRYAVNPLVMSTMDIAETLAGKMQGLQRVFTAKGGKSQTFHSTGASASTMARGWPLLLTLSFQYRRWEEQQCSVVIRYYPNCNNPDVVELSRWGLSPTMALDALYEATPFSFMLDWVTNLGSYLAAIRPKPELKILDACRTDTWKVKTSIYPTSMGYGYYTSKISGGGGIVSDETMIRSIITNVMTAPQLQFRSGGFKMLQALDLAAIVSQPLMSKLSKLTAALKPHEEQLRRKGLLLWEQSLLQSLKARHHQLQVAPP